MSTAEMPHNSTCAFDVSGSQPASNALRFRGPRVKRLLAWLSAAAATFVLAACGGSNGDPAPAPTGVVVTPGDGNVKVSWNAEPGVEYWIFFAPGTNITTENWTTLPGARVIREATSPQTIGGLLNGTTYAFTINGRTGGGPGGPGTPAATATPRPAGASWSVGASLGAGDLRGVVYGLKFVAVGTQGAAFSSADGLTWTPSTTGTTNALNRVIFSTAGYVAVGNGGTILTSTDLATWTARTSGTGNALNGVAFNGVNTHVAVGAGGTILTSTDAAVTWTAAASGTTDELYGVAFAAGRFIAVGAAGTLLTSADGTTWTAVASQTTQDLRALAFGASTIVAVGAAGTVITSSDAATWTARPAIGAADLASVAFGSQFVAVGSGGAIFTSADGVAWTAQSSGTTNELNAVAAGNFGYVAVGAAGANLTAY
jgi:hypothetical protein